MQRILLVPLVLLPAACRAPTTTMYEEPVAGGLLVRVVDARTGSPVPGAEVIAGPYGSLSPSASATPSFHDLLLAGEVGRTERFGPKWLCDDRGETRLPQEARSNPIIVRKNDLWGCSYRADDDRPRDPSVITIALEPDQSTRAVCTDSKGHPGVGALVWVGVGPRTGPDAAGNTGAPLAWGLRVTASDGSVDIPHAQFWRACVARGFNVRVYGMVLWSEEMHANAYEPYPLVPGDELQFRVSESGSVDIDAREAERNTSAMLRWLDPLDPDDPDEVPEFPIGIGKVGSANAVPALPLGHSFEIVLEVPGWVDPRVAFDGPKACGERVAIDLVPTERAACVTGRLVDVNGTPLAGRSIDARIERLNHRFDADGESSFTDEQGRFELEFAPVSGEPYGVLVFEVDLTWSLPEDGGRVIGTTAGNGPSRALARHELPQGLPAGEHDLGRVICRVQ